MLHFVFWVAANVIGLYFCLECLRLRREHRLGASAWGFVLAVLLAKAVGSTKLLFLVLFLSYVLRNYILTRKGTVRCGRPY